MMNLFRAGATCKGPQSLSTLQSQRLRQKCTTSYGKSYNHFFIVFSIIWVGFGGREVVKKLNGGGTTHSGQVSRQTEPWRPKSDQLCRQKYDLFVQAYLRLAISNHSDYTILGPWPYGARGPIWPIVPTCMGPLGAQGSIGPHRARALYGPYRVLVSGIRALYTDISGRGSAASRRS